MTERAVVTRAAERSPVDRGDGVRTVPLVTAQAGARAFLNGITEFDPGASLPFHSHNCEESVVVLEGEALFEVDGTPHTMAQGDATWVPAGVVHRFLNPGSGRLRILWTYGSIAATRTLARTGETFPIGSAADRAGGRADASGSDERHRPGGPEAPSVRIAHTALDAWLREALVRGGLTNAEAAVTAGVLAEADLRGVFSHGSVRLPDYLQLVREGRWRVGTEPQTLARAGSLVLLDGGHGVGPYIAMRAMEAAIDLAREGGAAWVWVRNGGHFGPAAAYTLRAARDGLVALAFTNSSPAMAAWGGRRAVLGANPWSIAIPRGQGAWPLVLDIANTVTSRGRIRAAAARGERLPSEWALDASGNPTTDPAEALKGTQRPIGGHKGYAIAFMVEALAAAVAGSAMSVEVSGPVPGAAGSQGVGQVFAALDVGALVPAGDLASRLDGLIAQMREGGEGEAGRVVLVPGEREALMAEEQDRLGIALPPEVWAAVGRAAAMIGLAPPSPAGEPR